MPRCRVSVDCDFGGGGSRGGGGTVVAVTMVMVMRDTVGSNPTHITVAFVLIVCQRCYVPVVV